jgi:NAD(P)H-nitrite reductase large subunit
MAVDRCVCHDVPFEELVRLNREEGLELEQLMDRTGCCTGCTSCEPYVKIALATGETDLPVMNGRELHEALKDAESRSGSTDT